MLQLEDRHAAGAWGRIGEERLADGAAIEQPVILFPKLEPEDVPQ